MTLVLGSGYSLAHAFPHQAADLAFWVGGPPTQPYSILTYALLHGTLLHLLVNCAGLSQSAPWARLITGHGWPGRARFVTLLIAVAVCAASTAGLLHDEPAPLIGASGVVSGMIGAAIPLVYLVAPRSHKLRHVLKIIVEFSAFGVILPIGLTLLGIAHVSWEAHFGGAITGLAISYWYLCDPTTRAFATHHGTRMFENTPETKTKNTQAESQH